MSNEVAKVETNAQVPAFMQNQEVMGTEGLNQYVRPPRVKVVQAMSGAPFDQFGQGTVIVVPTLAKLADVNRETKKSTPWKFVPLFFYPEWIQTSPMALKDTEPFIRQRSLDPKSELAQKARNRDTWFEKHPTRPDLEIANRECLNFVIMPYGDNPLAGTLCVITFSKSGFREGSTLASMIKMRKAPIYGQVFEANSNGNRKNAKGQWWGLDFNIPTEGQWVTLEEFEAFKAMHLELVEVHKQGLLQVDYDDEAAQDAPTSSEF